MVLLETLISIKLWCLYLVQHMLHQIKAPQLSTNYLNLISLVSRILTCKSVFFLSFQSLKTVGKSEKSLKSP